MQVQNRKYQEKDGVLELKHEGGVVCFKPHMHQLPGLLLGSGLKILLVARLGPSVSRVALGKNRCMSGETKGH